MNETQEQFVTEICRALGRSLDPRELRNVKDFYYRGFTVRETLNNLFRPHPSEDEIKEQQ